MNFRCSLKNFHDPVPDSDFSYFCSLESVVSVIYDK